MSSSCHVLNSGDIIFSSGTPAALEVTVGKLRRKDLKHVSVYLFVVDY